MSLSSGDLRKVAGKKRSGANLELVKSTIEELEDTKTSIEEWTEKVSAVREAVNELLEHQEEMDREVLTAEAADTIATAAQGLVGVLPGEDGPITEFSEYYDTAVSAADELESMLEDREYSAEERDEKWEEIVEQLGYMAEALDEFSSLHQKPDDSRNE